ncbi:MAG: transketolase [Ignavibacteriales bacterium]|nr:transketolase [Ignavibacteriales bacterium]
MEEKTTDIQQLCINTLRTLSIDAIQKANSGHPGMALGAAPILFLLYSKIMKYNPENSQWFNRDRFILSAGHASALLYSILHLVGYNISLDDIKNFRQWGSVTPGHPEYLKTHGVETTTGPLGQGFANAVGMAVSQKFIASKFNKPDFNLIDHYIYVLASDGDMMEGISHEAASFAGHNKLNNLIVFYDNNKITIDGSTSITMSDDTIKRFESYSWYVQHIKDINELSELEKSIENAKNQKEKPSLIIVDTHIGYGSPNKQDSSDSHGAPLGAEEVKLTKRNLSWDENKEFYIPDEVKDYFEKVRIKCKKYEFEWNELFKKYKEKYPDEAKLLPEVKSGNFGTQWMNKLPKFEDYTKSIATRKASGMVLNAIAEELPTLIGGSADLMGSNNVNIKNSKAFSAENPDGRNIFFGIREHAMASMLNGMSLYKGVIPFGATFLIFSDYLRPSIRIAAFSETKVIYVFTHDSIGVGEDGPTHQPIEQLSSLRAIPNVVVIRPADANETAFAWQIAIQHCGSPVILCLTRQDLPIIDRTKYNSATGTLKGAYILKDCGGQPEIILLATGSEISLSLSATEVLEKDGIRVRVVSFPSWELFNKQSKEYQEKVLPSNIKKRISIEAGIKQGWEKYVGEEGDFISIEKFGASAPSNILFEKYGFTVENIIRKAKDLLSKRVD